jgi:hypothetical protein
MRSAIPFAQSWKLAAKRMLRGEHGEHAHALVINDLHHRWP